MISNSPDGRMAGTRQSRTLPSETPIAYKAMQPGLADRIGVSLSRRVSPRLWKHGSANWKSSCTASSGSATSKKWVGQFRPTRVADVYAAIEAIVQDDELSAVRPQPLARFAARLGRAELGDAFRVVPVR